MSIQDIIKILAGTSTAMHLQVCKVKSVDADKRICDLEPLNGDAEILDARLQASTELAEGFVLVPKVNSFVVAGFFSKDAAVIVISSELEKVHIKVGDSELEVTGSEIIINGGENSGLVKVGELKDQIDNITNYLEALKDCLTTWVPVPSDGGAALQTYANTKLALVTKPSSVALENTKVKH
jgi:hypothetical protein